MKQYILIALLSASYLYSADQDIEKYKQELDKTMQRLNSIDKNMKNLVSGLSEEDASSLICRIWKTTNYHELDNKRQLLIEKIEAMARENKP